MHYVLIFLIFASLCTPLAADLDRPAATIHKGNFLRKRAPGTLFGFGQNIVDKNVWILYVFLNQAKAKKGDFISIVPRLVYGVTGSCSLLVQIPFVLKDREGTMTGRGIGDLTIQGEYAWYTKTRPTMINQATIVISCTAPTARISGGHTPALIHAAGAGTATFFAGFTSSHLSEKWYAYFSGAGLATLKDRTGNKLGNALYYQGGFGRFLGSLWGLTTTGLVEALGTFLQKSKTCRGHDENSGGNILYLGPSLFVGGSKTTLQVGIVFPVVQHLHGIQDKVRYNGLVSVSYAF